MAITKGVFSQHRKTMVAFDTKPGIGDMVWIDQATGIIYNYDDYRNKWLSASKDKFEYARKGAADGMNIPLLGDLDDVDDVYTLSYAATIVGILCRSKSGNNLKEFEILKNGAVIFSFNYDGSNSRLYINDNLNIDVNAFDELTVHVTKTGTSVSNTVCRIEVARRLVQ